MVVLVFFVLYVLMNGLPSINGLTGSGPQERYKPVNRFEGEKDSDEEDEDPTERRRMLEMSSFGGGPAYREQAQEDDEEESYTESRQPQNDRQFPMTSFSRDSENSSMLRRRDP